MEGSVPDDENRLVRQSRERFQIGCFGPSGGEVRRNAPAVAAEQLEQQDGGSGGCGEQYGAPGQVVDRSLGEERHAMYRAIAGDGEVRQEMVRRGVAGVLHRRHRAYLQRPGCE